MTNILFFILLLFWVALSIYFEKGKRDILKSMNESAERAINLAKEVRKANQLIVSKFDNVIQKLDDKIRFRNLKKYKRAYYTTTATAEDSENSIFELEEIYNQYFPTLLSIPSVSSYGVPLVYKVHKTIFIDQEAEELIDINKSCVINKRIMYKKYINCLLPDANILGLFMEKFTRLQNTMKKYADAGENFSNFGKSETLDNEAKIALSYATTA